MKGWHFFCSYVQHPIWWIMMVNYAFYSIAIIGQNEGFYKRVIFMAFCSHCPVISVTQYFSSVATTSAEIQGSVSHENIANVVMSRKWAR